MKKACIMLGFLFLVGCANNSPKQLNTSEDITLCKQGWNSSQQGYQYSAINYYNECIKNGHLTERTLSKTYRDIGIAYRRNAESREAIEYFNKSLSLNPPDPWSDYINRGNAWDDLGEFDNAMHDYNYVIDRYPTNGDALYNKGISLENQNKWAEASEEFNKAYNTGLRTPALMKRIYIHSERKKRGLE